MRQEPHDTVCALTQHQDLCGNVVSSPGGDQAAIYILWAFFKRYLVMLFTVCLIVPWSLLLKSSTGYICTTKCNRQVTVVWHEAKEHVMIHIHMTKLFSP